MFLWDFMVEVSFGAGGGSFKSVCISAGVIFVLTLDFVVEVGVCGGGACLL